MSQSILVTGASGDVGAKVIKGLEQINQPVVAAVRDIERAKDQLGEAISYVRFDFKQPSTFEAAFKGIKKLFLVRPPDISDTKKYLVPAIEAAKQAGVEQVVFLSLLGAEKNWIVPHYKVEQSLLTSGLDWTFLRASFFLQNLNTTHRDEIKNNNEIFVPAGKGKTSFIDARDIAAVAVKALTEDGHRRRAYDLTGNQALDYYEIAQHLSEVLGRTIRYTKPGLLRFGARLYRQKISLPFIIVMAGIYTTARLGRAAKVSGDTERLLGRAPITARQYIEDYKEAWL